MYVEGVHGFEKGGGWWRALVVHGEGGSVVNDDEDAVPLSLQRSHIVFSSILAQAFAVGIRTMVVVAVQGAPYPETLESGCENWQTGPSYRKISFGVSVGQLVQVTLASIEVGLSPFSFIHDLHDHVFIARLSVECRAEGHAVIIWW